MTVPAFVLSVPPKLHRCVMKRSIVRGHGGPMMGAHGISRRELSCSALSAAAAALFFPIASIAEGQTKKVAKPLYVKDESGISYYDISTGRGTYPQDGDFVTVDYVAFLSNGKVFDSRKNFVFQMGQRQVIPGLEFAIQGMRPGGQRKAVLPPALAYGKRGVCLEESRGDRECLVQPNETLGYDITLQRVALPPT